MDADVVFEAEIGSSAACASLRGSFNFSLSQSRLCNRCGVQFRDVSPLVVHRFLDEATISM